MQNPESERALHENEPREHPLHFESVVKRLRVLESQGQTAIKGDALSLPTRFCMFTVNRSKENPVVHPEPQLLSLLNESNLAL